MGGAYLKVICLFELSRSGNFRACSALRPLCAIHVVSQDPTVPDSNVHCIRSSIPSSHTALASMAGLPHDMARVLFTKIILKSSRQCERPSCDDPNLEAGDSMYYVHDDSAAQLEGRWVCCTCQDYYDKKKKLFAQQQLHAEQVQAAAAAARERSGVSSGKGPLFSEYTKA